MLKIFKLSPNSENCVLFRCFSSYKRAYQFKYHEPVYYPKRDLSKDDPKLALVQESTLKPAFSTNYYKVLGIRPSASSQEIKRAYYKLAKQYHPDAKPTRQETNSFRQISEAYHVLSDETSRHIFDEYGITKANTLHPIGDTMSKDWKDSYQHLSQNDKIEMQLKFLPAILGGREYINMKEMTKCPRCNGSARIKGQVNIEFCQKCGGNGQYKNSKQKFQTCDVCNGKRHENRNVCKICDNRGYIVHTKRLEVIVPPGTATGDIINVTNPSKNQILKIVANVEKSRQFKRDGNNIFSVRYLTISQAVLGGKFKIRGLYGDLEVYLGPGVESHTTHCFKGKGVIPTTGAQGDHTVTFKIRIPRNLTTKQRQLILALSRTEDPTFDGQ